MPTDRPDHESSHDDWLSLQEASELLGVTASTLRRWGDAGRVPMKRTLGGHRRFERDVISKLVDGQVPKTGSTPGRTAAPRRAWGVDEHELARQEWHARLATREHTDQMRGLGQRLLGLLIQYLNRRQDDGRLLKEARTVGANYGQETREANASMHDTVEAFLFFRNAFSELAMPIPGIAQPTDLDEALALQKRLNRFMDAILLGLISGYEGDEIKG